MFNEIHSVPEIRSTLTDILESASIDERAEAIDRLYLVNEGRKNSLTGKSANAINAMLAAYDPFTNLSVVSLNHRSKIIRAFGFSSSEEMAESTVGKQVVTSNECIKFGFKQIGITGTARILSEFCYHDSVKPLWAEPDEDIQEDAGRDGASSEELLFYMERHLEDFLIENWDHTALGQRYELLKNDQDELVSQQYPTDIGKIDILTLEKTTGRYAVIELKKNQTSDDTVGQLARYMGWIDEHLGKGKTSLGIIIAASFDQRLHYACRRVPDVELYEYRVDFHLKPMVR